MTLTEAYEKLVNARNYNGIMPNDAVDVILGAIPLLQEAFQTIKRQYGHVCDEFDICDHPACNSSYGAWSVADEALRAWEKREEQA